VSASNPFIASKTTLITGASSGIGRELAHVFARDGYRLVLVSRNRGALRELGDDLQSRYGITVRVSPKDLAHPASPIELYQELQEAGIVLDVLVNNAGFGGGGAFLDTDWNSEAEMMQVNMVALTHLTKLFLPQIRAREGKVLNVASTAAFQPGPFMAVYYASKAYVISFSQALAEELRGTGITVTCFCPGATATGFAVRAGSHEALLFKLPVSNASTMARAGFRGMLAGKDVVIPWPPSNWLVAVSARLLPRRLMLWFSRKSVEVERKDA
jgi:short-subunit dehydrogenase